MYRFQTATSLNSSPFGVHKTNMGFYEVIYKLSENEDDWTPLNPSRAYRHRSNAYRYAKIANDQWNENHPQF